MTSMVTLLVIICKSYVPAKMHLRRHEHGSRRGKVIQHDRCDNMSHTTC